MRTKCDVGSGRLQRLVRRQATRCEKCLTYRNGTRRMRPTTEPYDVTARLTSEHHVRPDPRPGAYEHPTLHLRPQTPEMNPTTTRAWGREGGERPSSPAPHNHNTVLCYAEQVTTITNFRHVPRRQVQRLVGWRYNFFPTYSRWSAAPCSAESCPRR